ncbi:hypothetical protein [Aureivirga sp. CE67]|uniref:hypothetical protein n=1 Tax=Aureivirga sp. CE67 TaxID=1788983 RepID=UPI0018C921E9|nr:hypothetical protein [Aureivirga sp. CE67]
MKKIIFLLAISFAFSTSLTSCKSSPKSCGMASKQEIQNLEKQFEESETVVAEAK